ncbi:endosome-associated-trafficking regulator 1 isoform X2 [Echeneis naucrates]|uniref:endosome-associated-trafficking regulator 1 isoform X2 n=1 Tax=Echeneis naucrates TaxID=173247 RepID=UPI001113670E|nr:endosome-associated-trafficking regulator 1 isoform X2 [Echeneis naucrates]
MSGQRSSKTLIITDDEEVGAEELNPFSFREFLRWKNVDPHQGQDQDQDQQDNQDQPSSSQPLSHMGNLTFDSNLQSCFFTEPSLASQEEEEDEGWGQSFQSDFDSTSSLYTDEEEETRSGCWTGNRLASPLKRTMINRFSSKPEVQQRGRGENYEGDDETSMAEAAISCRKRSGRSHIQQLKEENMLLRRTIRELQRRSYTSERRVLELSEELVQKRRQEEKEAQDLETMVHSVEQNLHLMTKRALKAENSVSKLRVELQQLQVEVESLRSENNGLKVAESQVVMTMKQNAQMASEYLNQTASHAESSIRQLLGEAETLRLVSHLLQSVDKISSVTSES